MNSTTTIDLLRHGEVQGGVCYRGSKDDPLSKLGWNEMVRATDNLQWDVILTSPLIRCAHFAAHLSPQYKIHHPFKEIDFGDWEGKTYSQLVDEQSTALENFIRDPENHSPPNGEALSIFRDRVIHEWEKVIADYKNEHILLIAHGGTIRTIISHILKIPASHMTRLEVKHASLSQIKIFDDNDSLFSSLIFHGKTPHE